MVINVINVRNIIILEVHLLFLADGLLEDKAREKDHVNVYIFQQPTALSKTGQFQINSDRRKKGAKDCIKASLV